MTTTYNMSITVSGINNVYDNLAAGNATYPNFAQIRACIYDGTQLDNITVTGSGSGNNGTFTITANQVGEYNPNEEF